MPPVESAIVIDFEPARLPDDARRWLSDRTEQVIHLLRPTPYRHLTSTVAACADLVEIAYPLADARTVMAPAEWMLWVYPLDEYPEKLSPSTADGMAYIDRIFAAMTAEHAPDEPVAAGMRRMWQLAGASMSPAWQNEFWADLNDYLTVAVRSATELRDKLLPDLDDFIALRRDLSGTKPTIDLIETTTATPLTDTFRAGPAWQECKNACADVIAWTNCYYSYSRETSEGEPHNLVNYFIQQQGMTVTAAKQRVAAMTNARVGEFRARTQALKDPGRRPRSAARHRTLHPRPSVLDARPPRLVPARETRPLPRTCHLRLSSQAVISPRRPVRARPLSLGTEPRSALLRRGPFPVRP